VFSVWFNPHPQLVDDTRIDATSVEQFRPPETQEVNTPCGIFSEQELPVLAVAPVASPFGRNPAQRANN